MRHEEEAVCFTSVLFFDIIFSLIFSIVFNLASFVDISFYPENSLYLLIQAVVS